MVDYSVQPYKKNLLSQGKGQADRQPQGRGQGQAPLYAS